ncbi:MAG TPA: hypothetical protein VLA56_03970 [Pseudomonadales bacterium]|nr:hypothetical protein [Pseudomonadales bacterium]
MPETRRQPREPSPLEHVSPARIASWAQQAETKAVIEKLKQDAVSALCEQSLATAEDRDNAIELIRRLQSFHGILAVTIKATGLAKREDHRAEQQRKTEGDEG